VGAEGARRRDRDINPPRVAGIEKDGMQAHSARPRLPHGTRPMPAQAGKFLPVLAAVGRLEDRRVFHSRVHRVGLRQGGLQVPDTLELPGMLCAVIPLMRSQWSAGRVIYEFIAL